MKFTVAAVFAFVAVAVAYPDSRMLIQEKKRRREGNPKNQC